MHRNIVLAFAAIALAAPASGAAQTTTAERERDRIEREREKVQAARDRALEREQARRDREQERRDREQERRERERERRERDGAGSLDTTVAFDANGTVSVTCPQGAVIVTGSNRNEIRVKARTDGGAIRFTSNGTRATLEPTSGRGCGDGRFEISVPVGSRVSARSWSGSVSVRGVHGDVESQTQSADVEVRDVGRLELTTLSGDVNVQGVKDATINTVSGDVELRGARGDVEIETVSGDLRLSDVVARQVRTHTTSGDLDFAGQIMDGGRYEFNTHSGEIGLELARDVGVQLSMSTFSGEIQSDFPITLKAGDPGIGGDRTKKLNFTLGQGTARIIAETFSGDITLRSVGRRQ